MLKFLFIRCLSTAIKRPKVKLSKVEVIKRLNYENKALFGAVIKPAAKKKNKAIQQDTLAKTHMQPVENEYSSEIFWQCRNFSREKASNGESIENASTSPGLVIPFSDKELQLITKFPLVPSDRGIVERQWVLHEKHETDQYKTPSVNRILSATMPEASRLALIRWKSSKIAELGEEGFQQLQKEIFARGSTLHATLEMWLSGCDPSEDTIEKTGVLWRSVSGALKEVERPAKVIEQKLYHPYLHYSGVVDCVTSIKGQYHVIEWKTSDNPKTNVGATYDAPVQLCAYLGALQANSELCDSPPTKECQYGGECYRVNPVHFREYAHPHIEKLLAKAASLAMVEIPDDVKVHKSVFTEQLKIVSNLFPHLSAETTNPEKKTKLEPTTSKPSSTINTVSPTASSVSKMDPKPSSSVGESKNTIESLFAERRAKMQAAQQSKPTPEPAKKETIPTPTRPVTSNTGISLQQALPRDINSYFPVVAERGRMAQKLAAAAPYNFFLTTITASKLTHTEPLSVTFQELLDSSLGELECSVQMNFMVDIGWLLAHYFFAGYENVPLLILYGDETPELRMVSQKKPNVTAVKVEIKTPFGVHHTKMGLYGYRDGSMRIVVSTANLYEDDWHNRTQGLWISPRLPAVPDGSDTTFGESRTDFRSSLLTYLDAYKLPQLQPWMARIRKTDFSDVKVFLVASVPGGHTNTPKGPLWGHPRLGYLLSQHAAPIDDSCPLVAQSSSIGSLGPSPESWVLGEILASFRKDSAPVGIRRLPGFRMIYPSFSNVRQSHDGMMGGGCLPYVKSTHVKQEWLKDYLHQWCSRTRHRNKAMPHIKTYCRWSHRGLYWFLLTSANLSKAAWGVYNKTGRFEKPLRINSYEVGVLFLPKLLPTHTDLLSVSFQELLDSSLGELECSLQIHFVIDINWPLEHYSSAGYEQLPLLILYDGMNPKLEAISEKHPNDTVVKIDVKTSYGTHHTKMGLYGYSDGSTRIVISTANLYEGDWHNRTQGL
uniref:PBZ-type domain-containing protein n=1 Tax=Anopheles christyi TaxID=43041 RepID=A0A182JRK8_9DIPT